MSNQLPVNFTDNPHAPDIFADAATGIAVVSGLIRVTFESAKVYHGASPGVNRVVVGRLVMPLSAAEGLLNLLSDYIAKVKIHGAIPPALGPTSVH
jgi:hypothetical protein